MRLGLNWSGWGESRTPCSHTEQDCLWVEIRQEREWRVGKGMCVEEEEGGN